MCLITFAYRAHADYPLLVAANRDEYYARPTAGLRFWEDLPDVAAGRDLQAGGTWLGITRSGRFAAITNHRNPPTTPASPRSRGMLTLDFLAGEAGPEGFLEKLAPRAGEYAGFNLLLGDDETLWYFSNIEGRPRRLEPGVHDRTPAPDHSLPDTGVGLELERALSSQFITMPEYGTRATTTLSVHREGTVELVERAFTEGGRPGERLSLAFRLGTDR